MKDVCFFTDELTQWGFVDNLTLSDEERKEELLRFLDRFILFFNIEHKRGRSLDDYYTAKNISIHKKADNFKEGVYLQSIPIFSEKTTDRTQKMFEQQLVNQRLVGDNKQISKEDDDTPTMVLWRKRRWNKVYGLRFF
nr:hypothetical protein P5645_15695 [Bacillus subtilis]